MLRQGSPHHLEPVLPCEAFDRLEMLGRWRVRRGKFGSGRVGRTGKWQPGLDLVERPREPRTQQFLRLVQN